MIEVAFVVLMVFGALFLARIKQIIDESDGAWEKRQERRVILQEVFGESKQDLGKLG